MYGVACLIECVDRRFWLFPKFFYKDELQARVTVQHLEKLMSHFLPDDDLHICFFVQAKED